MSEKPKLAGLFILIIDQHGATVRGFKGELTNQGAKVLLAGDFTTALNLVKQSAVQAILLDVDSLEQENFEEFLVLQKAAKGSLFYLFFAQFKYMFKNLKRSHCFPRFGSQRHL